MASSVVRRSKRCSKICGPSSSAGSICANRFVQATVVVLVMIMALWYYILHFLHRNVVLQYLTDSGYDFRLSTSLVAMATLYILDWQTRKAIVSTR